MRKFIGWGIGGLLTILLGGIAAYGYGRFTDMEPERRAVLKNRVGLALSPVEAIRFHIVNRPGYQNSSLQHDLITEKGDMCGEIRKSGDSEYEFFIFSPGNFFDTASDGLIALGSDDWARIAAVEKLTSVIAIGGDVGWTNRRLFFNRWKTHCGNELPIEVRAKYLRNKLGGFLKDPQSAVFRNEKLTPLGYCGELNAKNSMGGFVGFKQFYLVHNEIWQLEDGRVYPLRRAGAWEDPAMEGIRSESASSDVLANYFKTMWAKVCL